MEYTLTRSRRKTIGIYIHKGKVEVRAPLHTTKADIEEFIHSKRTWIEKHLPISMEKEKNKNTFQLTYGSRLLYRGSFYPIEAKSGNNIGFDGTYFYLPPHLSGEAIMGNVVTIYRHLANQYLPFRTNQILEKAFSSQTPIPIRAVRVNSAKTRWGSCSSKGNLNFSWRLIMADDRTIDYVIVHEIAHLFEMNHSPAFWGIVKRVLPDYQECRKRLKELERRLSGENWGKL